MNGRESTSIVHVVDDDAAFLESMSRLLRSTGYDVRTFSSAASFLTHLNGESSGCVIIDLAMPGLSGLDLQDALAQMGCAMPTIFLTGHGDIPSSVRAMRHGAEDFLTKLAPKEQLFDAIARAMERDRRQRRQRANQAALRARFALLSPREHEVLRHVLLGRLNKQIAMSLGIHERTVKLHRTGITAKIGVHSVAELSHLAHEAGIFEPHAGQALH